MLVGIVFILIGLYYLLKVLVPGFDFDLSWTILWPIILIVIGLNHIVKFKRIEIFNVVITLIGVIYLLEGLNLIGHVNYKAIVAIVLIGIGLSIITVSFKAKRFKKLDKTCNKEGVLTYTGVFSDIEEKVNDDDFKGASCYAVFGGIELNLKDTKIKNDVVINCFSVFGGVDLIVPSDVNVVVKSNSVFGGVENKNNNKKNDKNKTIYVNATAIFGGIDLK